MLVLPMPSGSDLLLWDTGILSHFVWSWFPQMVGWHHRVDDHEFEQALGISDGQGSLVCCSPWGYKESDMPERLN